MCRGKLEENQGSRGLSWFSLLLQKGGESWPGVEVGTAERVESGGSLVLFGFLAEGWGVT